MMASKTTPIFYLGVFYFFYVTVVVAGYGKFISPACEDALDMYLRHDSYTIDIPQDYETIITNFIEYMKSMASISIAKELKLRTEIKSNTLKSVFQNLIPNYCFDYVIKNRNNYDHQEAKHIFTFYFHEHLDVYTTNNLFRYLETKHPSNQKSHQTHDKSTVKSYVDRYTSQYWEGTGEINRDQVMCTKLFQLYLHESENLDIQLGAKINFKQRCIGNDETKFKQLVEFYKIVALRKSCDDIVVFNFYPLENLGDKDNPNPYFRNTVTQFLKATERNSGRAMNFDQFWHNPKFNTERKVAFLKSIIRGTCFASEITDHVEKEFRLRILLQVKYIFNQILDSSQILQTLENLKKKCIKFSRQVKKYEKLHEKDEQKDQDQKEYTESKRELCKIREDEIRIKDKTKVLDVKIKHKFPFADMSNYYQETLALSFTYPNHDNPNLDFIVTVKKLESGFKYDVFFNPQRKNILYDFDTFTNTNEDEDIEIDFEAKTTYIGTYFKTGWKERNQKNFNPHGIVDLLYRNNPKSNFNQLKKLNENYISKIQYKDKDNQDDNQNPRKRKITNKK